MRALVSVAAFGAALSISAVALAAPKPTIAITTAKVSGTSATVDVKISGFTLLPSVKATATGADTGLWRVLVDGKPRGLTANPSKVVLQRLATGKHSLRAELVTGTGKAMTAAAKSRTVDVTVS